MPTVAVIGGIGCGKSTVTSIFAALGAAVVDADVIARGVVAKGSPHLDALVSAFGPGILDTGGSLDRDALAAVAFANKDATQRMNAILHPAIGVALVEQVDAACTGSQVVVVAIPLFRAEHRELLGIDRVVCVDCPREVALERLKAGRGFDLADAERRMAAQSSREERRALADVVIDNTGSIEDLERDVQAVWKELVAS